MRDARTIQGNYGANARAKNRHRLTLLRISRVDIALDRYRAHLPPAFAARVRGYPAELMHPPRPIGGITAAEDRAMRHAVAASLALWRAAFAEARAAHTNAASSPPALPPVPIVSYTGDSLPDCAPPPTARRKGHRRPVQPRRSNQPVRTPSRPRHPCKTANPRFSESTP